MVESALNVFFPHIIFYHFGPCPIIPVSDFLHVSLCPNFLSLKEALHGNFIVFVKSFQLNQSCGLSMRIHVLVFWIMMSCCDARRYQCFGGPCCFHLQHTNVLESHAEDGSSMDLQNICILPHHYMTP